jgi:ABC-type uncharacterized transport system substrate-binding protein
VVDYYSHVKISAESALEFSGVNLSVSHQAIEDVKKAIKESLKSLDVDNIVIY